MYKRQASAFAAVSGVAVASVRPLSDSPLVGGSSVPVSGAPLAVVSGAGVGSAPPVAAWCCGLFLPDMLVLPERRSGDDRSVVVRGGRVDREPVAVKIQGQRVALGRAEALGEFAGTEQHDRPPGVPCDQGREGGRVGGAFGAGQHQGEASRVVEAGLSDGHRAALQDRLGAQLLGERADFGQYVGRHRGLGRRERGVVRGA